MPEPARLREVEPVDDASRAGLLLHPLRQRILSEAREASTAAEIARRVGIPAQRVNYHVRTLVEAGFLQPAGEGRKRNLIEKRYRATAQSYLLLPQVLGEMGPREARTADRFSALHLMRLSALLQDELASCLGSEGGTAHDVPTLSLEGEIRFDSAEQRAAFADALQRAVADVIGRYTAPSRDEEGRSRPGRAFRLLLGCYPVPVVASSTGSDSDDEETDET